MCYYKRPVFAIYLQETQILGSAYLFGAGHEHLDKIYEHDAKELEPWEDSPGEISTHDWREYLGKGE